MVRLSANRNRRAKRRFLTEFKNQQKCLMCGSSHQLTLHHRTPKTKKYCANKMVRKNWPIFLKELRKCDVLCDTCHTLIHNELGLDFYNRIRPILAKQKKTVRIKGLKQIASRLTKSIDDAKQELEDLLWKIMATTARQHKLTHFYLTPCSNTYFKGKKEVKCPDIDRVVEQFADYCGHCLLAGWTSTNGWY